jgi:hypothetical protein
MSDDWFADRRNFRLHRSRFSDSSNRLLRTLSSTLQSSHAPIVFGRII